MIPAEPHARFRVKMSQDPLDRPGSVLENAEGTAARWLEFDQVLEGFSDFVYLAVTETGEDGTAYVGDSLCLRREDVEQVAG